jgi:uncharacterized membrane protein YfcA
MNIKIIYTILVGTLSGILGGAFGLGGDFIMLPFLIFLKIVPDYHTAVGTVLFTLLFPISLLAVIQYNNKNQVDFLIGSILFISYFFSAYFGAKINGLYDEKTLKYSCATCFLIITIYFYYDAYTSK